MRAAAHSSEVTALPLSASHNLVMPSTVWVPLPSQSMPQSTLLANLPCEGWCQWALTQKRTLGAAAHLSVEILVSLRTAASAEAPLSPILLSLTLRVRGGARMVREQRCQRAQTQKRTFGVATPERGHGAPLEPLAQLGEAQGGVGPLGIAIIILVEAAELVAVQAAKGGEECQWALTG